MAIQNVRDFVYQLTGNYYSEDRLHSLKQKAAQMLKDKGIISTVSEFDKNLEVLLKDKELVDELISYITINETSFFRHIDQINAFKNHFLKDILRDPSGKILSAGCSTGEEPYTLAMISLSLQSTLKRKIIIGIDISTRALNIAKKGEYPARYERYIPEEYKKYVEIDGKVLRVKKEVKEIVYFHKGNVIASKCLYNNYFSTIFFRNVLIYFTEEKKRKALENLHKSLKENGVLVLAPTETIGAKNQDLFEPFKVDRFVFFRKR